MTVRMVPASQAECDKAIKDGNIPVCTAGLLPR